MSDDLTLLERLLGVQKEEHNWDAGYGEEEQSGLPGLSCSASLLDEDKERSSTRTKGANELHRELTERQQFTLSCIPEGEWIPIKRRF